MKHRRPVGADAFTRARHKTPLKLISGAVVHVGDQTACPRCMPDNYAHWYAKHRSDRP